MCACVIYFHGEVNIADAILYLCVSTRTAASVHIAKWSPDGEYFATVGKVLNYAPALQSIQSVWHYLQDLLGFLPIMLCVCVQDDCLLKVWYPTTGWRSAVVVQDPSDKKPSPVHFSFVYLAHPRSVTGMSWRKTSKYMPK